MLQGNLIAKVPSESSNLKFEENFLEFVRMDLVQTIVHTLMVRDTKEHARTHVPFYNTKALSKYVRRPHVTTSVARIFLLYK